jgi:hypothetical protein
VHSLEAFGRTEYRKTLLSPGVQQGRENGVVLADAKLLQDGMRSGNTGLYSPGCAGSAFAENGVGQAMDGNRDRKWD